MDLNKAMIIGRLTRDPEVRTTPTGQSVASFGVATNYTWTDQAGQKQEKVEFHNVVVWRRLAEICGQYLRKGSKAYFEGRLQTRDWLGQDGNKRYTTEIIVDNMIMLDSKGTGASPLSQPQGQARSYEQPVRSSEPIIDESVPAGMPIEEVNSDDIKVENIPF